MTDSITTVAQVPALDFRDLASEVSKQPDLFAALAGIPDEQAIVRAASDKRYTGDRVPEARATQIVALRLSGCSLREIERRIGADHRTVSAVVAIAERQGIIPALKEAVQRQVLELTEETIEVVRRELRSEEPDAQLIKAGWVGAGIGMDKAAMVAPVGELHLHLHQGAVAAGSDPAAEYARLLRGAPSGPTVDAESEVSAVVVPRFDGSAVADTVLGAAPGGADAGPGAPSVDAHPGASRLAADQAAAGADRGAGGVATSEVGGGGDGKA